MLPVGNGEFLRSATPDDLDRFLAGAPRSSRRIVRAAAEDEAFFLGLRLNRGIDLRAIEKEFGPQAVARRSAVMDELWEAGLLRREECTLSLTDRGRLLSNEVFERLTLAPPPAEDPTEPPTTLIKLQ
jgi:oxygen-independent coproporphyrinogen-3 oxidase